MANVAVKVAVNGANVVVNGKLSAPANAPLWSVASDATAVVMAAETASVASAVRAATLRPKQVSIQKPQIRGWLPAQQSPQPLR